MQIYDFKEIVNRHYGEVTKIINDTDLQQKYNNDVMVIDEILSKIEPSMMFFGVYNAGKSTLLNAIFGKGIASVADVPETHRVTSYDWNNFKLVDTPGINGPENDERVSKTEIRKHDVILFVIDDGDTFDTDKVTNEILEIIIEQRPLILVLNCKQNLDNNVVNSKREKIAKNIDRAAEIKNIGNVFHKYEFIAVDAKTAYQARLENSELLLKHSNIEPLENAMSRHLEKSDTFKSIINPVKQICQLIDKLLLELDSNITNSKQKYLVDMLADLSNKKAYAIKSTELSIRNIVADFNKEMYSCLTNGGDIESLNKDLSEKVKDIIVKAVEKLTSDIDLEVKNINIEVKSEITISKLEEKKYNTTNTIESVQKNNDDLKELEKALDDLILITIPVPPIPTPIPIPVPILVALGKLILHSFIGNKKNKPSREEVEAQAEAKRQQEIERQNALQEARRQINSELYKFQNQSIENAKASLQDRYNLAKNTIEQLLEDENNQLYQNNLQAEKLRNAKLELEVLIDKSTNL